MTGAFVIFLLTSLLCQPSLRAQTPLGSVSDPRLRIIREGAHRYYYAGSSLETSVRTNSLGNEQVLFYDVYKPTG